MELDLTADTIDVRDIIERVEELQQAESVLDAYNIEELNTLMAILDDLKGNGGDEEWNGDWYPVTLIRESYFEEYAKDFAMDIGAVSRGADKWPKNHIDWKAAAEELQNDYSETEIEGATYYYR